ncbi:MAG: 50S ribosomal protein L6 [Thermoanaerobacterales bacterium 50_218]|nr:MAG: 50S ribosomal protein L6 [Thermoanaerobacterales bacterium 50_218]HAA90117.1 50S ribosomal protein L6 [Peptococcaceae bacterium]
MSRVGRLPVMIPAGVEVKVEGNVVEVKGPKGRLVKEMPQEINISVEDNKVVVTRSSDEKKHRALHGLTRALIQNMVIGVTEGFQKSLELVGVGYRAAKQGKKLVLTVGYSHPVEIEPEEGLEIEVPAPNKIVVSGIDKEKVGALAARIRSVRKPDPYKGKGIRYEGEVIKLKAGKAGVKGK